MIQDDTTDPWGVWRGRIGASRNRRDQRIGDWQENVNARKGSLGRLTDGASPRMMAATAVSVNQDWPLTKAKIAQLYSQTPEVRLTARFPEFQQAIPIFGRELNDTISDVSVGTTMEEVLSDVVNASGIGGVLVSCDVKTVPKAVPIQDPSLLPPAQMLAVLKGAPLPTTTVDQPVDIRYLAQRISPADLLIPDDFTGSNYNQARWLGEEGRMTWAQAQTLLGLTDEVKEKVLGKDKRSGSANNSLNTDTTAFRDTDVVHYQQLFYWRHFYHAEETNFKALQRLVFVEGLDEPKVNEPYKAQQRGEDGRLVGVTLNPIQILTLTYVSDDALPPSDSSISRFQVDELTQSRDAMVQQRKHSLPIRWGDTNRISTNARAKLDKGNYQDFIWTNGPGERAIGEVARASFPQEKFEFDRIIKNDITEIWQVGTNQAGAFSTGERSASEAKIVQANFQTRVGQERDKVTRFFLGIAEVLAGHLALYGTFDVPDELGIQRQALATGFTYSVRADSTVRKDAEQRIEQLKEFFNLTAQTGYINPKPIIEEWAELSGLDPSKVVVDPQPKPPEPVKVSVSKAEDLMNPIFLAMLMRTHQGPLPEDLTAAVKMLMTVEGAMPPAIGAPPPPGGPPTDVQTPEIRNPNMETAPRIERRKADAGA